MHQSPPVSSHTLGMSLPQISNKQREIGGLAKRMCIKSATLRGEARLTKLESRFPNLTQAATVRKSWIPAESHVLRIGHALPPECRGVDLQDVCLMNLNLLNCPGSLVYLFNSKYSAILLDQRTSLYQRLLSCIVLFLNAGHQWQLCQCLLENYCCWQRASRASIANLYGLVRTLFGPPTSQILTRTLGVHLTMLSLAVVLGV